MSSRRFAGAGLMRRAARSPSATTAIDVAAFSAAWKTELDAVAANSARHLWLIDSTTTTLVSGNASGCMDAWGAANMAQGTAANRPLYVASGAGPNNRPYITNESLGDNLRGLNATISFADGNRIGFYAVCAVHSTDQVAEMSLFRASGTGATLYRSISSSHRGSATFSGPTTQNITITAPALSTNWLLYAFRPLASGCLSQINGSTTTANYTGSTAQAALTAVTMLRPLGFGGGRIALLAAVDDPTDAKDTIMRSRIATLFGSL